MIATSKFLSICMEVPKLSILNQCLTLVTAKHDHSSIFSVNVIYYRGGDYDQGLRLRFFCNDLSLRSLGLSLRSLLVVSIIHSKYFTISDFLKSHAEFTITSHCMPY